MTSLAPRAVPPKPVVRVRVRVRVPVKIRLLEEAELSIYAGFDGLAGAELPSYPRKNAEETTVLPFINGDYVHPGLLKSSWDRRTKPLNSLWVIAVGTFLNQIMRRRLMEPRLASVLLLCCLQAGLSSSSRLHYAGDMWFSAYTEPSNFSSAQKVCMGRNGQLMTVRSQDSRRVVEALLGGVTGKYWIGLRLPDARCPRNDSQLRGYEWISGGDLGNATDVHTWSAYDSSCDLKGVSVSAGDGFTWSQESPSSTLRGFLCEFSLNDACGSFAANASQAVLYTVIPGFEPTSWPMHPKGTISERHSYDGSLESRAVCFSANWVEAPWSCEVMLGGCDHACALQAGAHVCTCPQGFRLHPNNLTCVDVDECDEPGTCPDPNTMCQNTEGGFKCVCNDHLYEYDDECIDTDVCAKCEHMLCEKHQGGYRCGCRAGFKVSDVNPNRCVMACGEQCPPICIENTSSCRCLDGYIIDTMNGTTMCYDLNECEQGGFCQHTCQNTYGGYECSCHQGFHLVADGMCEPTNSLVVRSTTGGPEGPSITHPTAVPSYVRVGSLLGIMVFVALGMALLFALLCYMHKHCGTFELPSFQRPDVDIFHLQQVTTEKYKKFSYDKQQGKYDMHRL